MVLAPDALVNDGLFDILIFRDVGVTDITLLPKIYKGSHLECEKVHNYVCELFYISFIQYKRFKP